MNTILQDNEKQANTYTTLCLLLAAGLLLACWVLNGLGFFVVNPLSMNLISPIGIVLLGFPYLLDRKYTITSTYWKYAIMLTLLLGITLLSAMLTIHTVLLWACPIILSCHYYAPKFTRFTLIGSLVGMLIGIYAGVYIGVWDSNIMHSSQALRNIPARLDYLASTAMQGDTILQGVFHYYYLPRAMLLCLLYFACTTLSKRTYRLFTEYQDISGQRERMQTELSVAQSIQVGMLPCIFPAFPDCPAFDLYATMHPAKLVGGDFYDFFRIDADHIALVVADVSGKGIPASLFMMISKILLKNQTRTIPSPKSILETVNNQLCEGNAAEMFVTVWLGIYQLSTGTLTAANAGHEYPIHRPAGGDFTLVHDRHGFVLAGMEDSRYHEYQLQLGIGDTLFLYTDGVTEATNADHQLFGKERLLTTLNAHKNEDMTTLLQQTKLEIDAFVGDAPQFDDITMLGFQVRI